jgi:hypothetical protein
MTGSVLLEYDPGVLSAGRVIDLLAAHGYILRATEVKAEAASGWADKLASAAMDWVINALVERLTLAVIKALAWTRTEQCQSNSVWPHTIAQPPRTVAVC